ncbi:MAG: hypothetical protein JW844_00235 [Candidatus Omnitrophica bacterium]|nr:hypothetical protein [Candidatus Omnitrophota bacterium]
MKKQAEGLSLVELAVVMIVVLILAIGAVTAFQSFLISVKVTAVKQALEQMRRGIKDFYIDQTLQGSPRFPVLEEVSEDSGRSVVMIDGNLPDNPLDTDGDRDNVVEALSEPRGTIIGTTGGWVYRPRESSPGARDAGEIWANTATPGIDENTF